MELEYDFFSGEANSLLGFFGAVSFLLRGGEVFPSLFFFASFGCMYTVCISCSFLLLFIYQKEIAERWVEPMTSCQTKVCYRVKQLTLLIAQTCKIEFNMNIGSLTPHLANVYPVHTYAFMDTLFSPSIYVPLL